MQIYTRYRVAKRRWSFRAGAYGLLAIAGLVFLVWVFLRSAEDLERSTRPRPAPATQPSPVARLAPRTLAPTTPPPSAARAVPVPTNGVASTNPAAMIQVPLPAARPASGTLDGVSPQPARTVLEAQLALARQGISCGSLDGILGAQTRAAVRTFQRQEGLRSTGVLDRETLARLTFLPPPFTNYLVTSDDLARLMPVSRTWLGKSQQQRLDYESLLELVAEKAQAHPGLLRRLNPQVDWTSSAPGMTLLLPNVAPPVVRARAASVRIQLAARTLQAFDSSRNLLAHFPCSIARLVEKRPVGTLRVVLIIRNPSYTFNPAVFPESEEGQRLGRKLLVPPGPNNPVGTAWIGLDRPGYGIHGTPRPEEVGRTESHGCFRLANWNAEYLAQLVSVGTPVSVEP